MNKMEFVRGGAEIVIGLGVGAVVGNLIKATTPINAGKLQQAAVSIGGWAIGGVVSDIVAVQAVGRLDQAAKWLSQHVNVQDGQVIVVQEGESNEKSEEPEQDSDNSNN